MAEPRVVLVTIPVAAELYEELLDGMDVTAGKSGVHLQLRPADPSTDFYGVPAEQRHELWITR